MSAVSCAYFGWAEGGLLYFQVRAERLYDAVGHGLDHELARSSDLLPGEVRSLRENVVEALVEDLLRPARPHNARPSDADQEVSRYGGRTSGGPCPPTPRKWSADTVDAG